jgi:hypothetical protein
MHRPSYERVIDQMVSALAEQRRTRLERHAAYVALARAILDEDTLQLRDLPEINAVAGLSGHAAA